MPARKMHPADNVSSGTSYVDYPFMTLGFSDVKILIKNTGGHNINYKIYGYLDRDDTTNSGEQVKAETALASGGASYTEEITNNCYDLIIISVQSEVEDQNSTYEIFANKVG